jgi:hypothetical protein
MPVAQMTDHEKKMTAFEQELTGVINRHSLENDSDTPDFILAEYLRRCLDLFNTTVHVRLQWGAWNPPRQPVSEFDLPDGPVPAQDPLSERLGSGSECGQ